MCLLDRYPAPPVTVATVPDEEGKALASYLATQE